MARKKITPSIKLRLNMPLDLITACKENKWTVSGAVKTALPILFKEYQSRGVLMPGKKYSAVKTTSINIPPLLADKLKEMADITGFSMTSIILQALENFLDLK